MPLNGGGVLQGLTARWDYLLSDKRTEWWARCLLLLLFYWWIIFGMHAGSAYGMITVKINKLCVCILFGNNVGITGGWGWRKGQGWTDDEGWWWSIVFFAEVVWYSMMSNRDQVTQSLMLFYKESQNTTEHHRTSYIVSQHQASGCLYRPRRVLLSVLSEPTRMH